MFTVVLCMCPTYTFPGAWRQGCTTCLGPHHVDVDLPTIATAENRIYTFYFAIVSN